MLSFPRDSMVPVYRCPAGRHFGGRQPQPGGLEAPALTYAQGGPGCAWKTIGQSTGIRIGCFAEAGCTGSGRFVSALGGADVCLPFPLDIPSDGLGCQRDATTSAAPRRRSSRARGIGQWPDIQRITRQQFFMIA